MDKVDNIETITHTSSAPAVLESFDSQSKLHFSFPKASLVGGVFLIFKYLVGAGIFGLPYAVKQMGIGGFTLAMVFSAVSCYYTSMLTIRVFQTVTRFTLNRNHTFVSLSYSILGNNLGRIVYFFMIFSSIGGLGAYLILLGTTMESLLPLPSSSISSPVIAYIGFFAILVLPLGLNRSNGFLTYSSMIGNIGVLVAIVTICVSAFIYGNFSSNISTATNPSFIASTFPTSIGIVSFIWASSTGVITIEKSMQHHQSFKLAFQITTGIVFSMAMFFCLLMFFAYGSSVNSNILLNINDKTLGLVAKISLVIEVFLSYPIGFAPVAEVVEKSLLSDVSSNLEMKRSLIRVSIVLCSFLFAMIPGFNVVLNLIGGWGAASLTYLFPPLMLLQLRYYHVLAHTKQLEFYRKYHISPLRGDKRSVNVLSQRDFITKIHPFEEQDANARAGKHSSSSSSSSPKTPPAGHLSPSIDPHVAHHHSLHKAKSEQQITPSNHQAHQSMVAPFPDPATNPIPEEYSHSVVKRWWFVLNTLFMHSYLHEDNSDEISTDSPSSSTSSSSSFSQHARSLS
jgi:amino acid permease